MFLYSCGWKVPFVITKGRTCKILLHNSLLERSFLRYLLNFNEHSVCWILGKKETGWFLKRAISPRDWWWSKLSGNLAHIKDVKDFLQLSLDCPKSDCLICWAPALCREWEMRKPATVLAKADSGLKWRTLVLNSKMSVRVLVLPVVVKLCDLKEKHWTLLCSSCSLSYKWE